MGKFVKNISIIIVVSLSNLLIAQNSFFLNDWAPKNINSPLDYEEVEKTSNPAIVRVAINFADTLTKVSKYNFGNNANIYSTKMWDNLVLVENVKNLNPHVLRYPGGNLSNEFFWDRDDLNRPMDIPENLPARFGQTDDPQEMSVDDYYKFLEEVGATGIICVNYSYARYGTSANPVSNAAHHAANWVRFDNGRTKFWEIGNENFGEWQAGYEIDTTQNQDGQPQFISGELYGQHSLIFMDSMKTAAAEIGHEIFIGLGAWEAESSYNPVQTVWNEKMMPVVGENPDFYAVHSYFTPYDEDSDAGTILSTYKKPEEFRASVYSDLAEFGLSEKPIALTEYNIFAVNSMQQVSHINGLQASLVLGEVIKSQYGLSARWNLANGWNDGNDHGMFSKDEPEVTPFTPHADFYHMVFFQKYFGDVMVDATSSFGNIEVYASGFSSGQAGIVLINKGQFDLTTELTLNGFVLGDRLFWFQLNDEAGDGSFSRKVFVNGQGPDQIAGGPKNYSSIQPYSNLTEGGIKVDCPAYSAIYMLVDGSPVNSIQNENKENKLTGFRLYQNYPNPFNPSTTISYQTGSAAKVQILILDIQGRLIRVYNQQSLSAGQYSVTWDGTNNFGDPVASGVYFYQLSYSPKSIPSPNIQSSRKMILIR